MPEVTPVIMIAASGLARETFTVLRRLDRPVVGLLDDEPGLAGTIVSTGDGPGLGVLGPLSAVVDHPDAELVICAGKGRSRHQIAERLRALGIGPERFATVVDPSVHVPAGCSIGVGSIVLAGCVLTADVTIGAQVVLMPRVVLTHDDVVEDCATLCAGVTLGGSVTVGEAAYLGMSSSVREHVQVGPGSVLGMGSVLLTDLPPDQTWAGVPARPLRSTTPSPISSPSTESVLP